MTTETNIQMSVKDTARPGGVTQITQAITSTRENGSTSNNPSRARRTFGSNAQFKRIDPLVPVMRGCRDLLLAHLPLLSHAMRKRAQSIARVELLNPLSGLLQLRQTCKQQQQQQSPQARGRWRYHSQVKTRQIRSMWEQHQSEWRGSDLQKS